jgi:hypothetical protein
MTFSAGQTTTPFAECRERSAGELAHDPRGFIAFAGIVGGALLVAALWHIVSVGDAIVWRERAQDTADAAAFQNAVLQARGMNAIVVLNLIMALVMSLLIIWRMIELFLAALLVGSGILCATTGFGCALMGLVARAEIWFVQKDPQFSRAIARVCAGVNVLEKVVATAAPAFAAVQASTDPREDYGGTVFAVSPSLVSPEFMSLPYPRDRRSLVNRVFRHNVDYHFGRCFRGMRGGGNAGAAATNPPARRPPAMATSRVYSPDRSQARKITDQIWHTASQERMGVLVSLPVMQDRIGALCAQAGNYFDEALISATAGGDLSFLTGALGKISSLKGMLFAAAPSLFCMPPEDGVQSLGSLMQDSIKNEVKDRCSWAEAHYRAASPEERTKWPLSQFYVKPEDRPMPGLLFGPKESELPIDPQSGFNREKCRVETQKEQEAAVRKAEDSRKALNEVLECVKPAKVWELATNGNLFMQSFSFVHRDANSERADRLLDVGDRQETGNVVPIETPWIRAQAEMYFDCRDTWVGCDSTAMWQVRWRARLRRIQPLNRMVSDALALTLATGISHGLQRFFGDRAYDTGHRLGTDAKFGNVSNYPRDVAQAAGYWLFDELIGMDGTNSKTIH